MADPIDIGGDWEAEPVDHDPFAADQGGESEPPQTYWPSDGERGPAMVSQQGLGSIAQNASQFGGAPEASNMPYPEQSSSAGAWAPPPMDPQDRDALIRTITGEAGGEPPEGQAAIAHTVFNRVADGGYGDSVKDVVQAPVKPGSQYHEFSAWNPPGVRESSAATHGITPSDPTYAKIGNIVDQAHRGLIPDPTNGATHYYAPRSMPAGKAPPWAAPLAKENTVRIGNQVFVGRSQGPGQRLPSQITGGPLDEGMAGT